MSLIYGELYIGIFFKIMFRKFGIKIQKWKKKMVHLYSMLCLSLKKIMTIKWRHLPLFCQINRIIVSQPLLLVICD